MLEEHAYTLLAYTLAALPAQAALPQAVGTAPRRLATSFTRPPVGVRRRVRRASVMMHRQGFMEAIERQGFMEAIERQKRAKLESD